MLLCGCELPALFMVMVEVELTPTPDGLLAPPVFLHTEVALFSVCV